MDSKKPLQSLESRRHCQHSAFHKEFVAGIPTGSYICANCGKPLSHTIRPHGR